MLTNADGSQAGHGVVMADIPDPEVAPRAQSRTFAPSYKVRILTEFEALPKAERAGFLRREGLLATLIRKWQAQAARAGDAGLGDRRPGPRAGDPTVKESAGLKAQVTRLQDDLADSRAINDEQVKLMALLGELSKSAVRQDGASS